MLNCASHTIVVQIKWKVNWNYRDVYVQDFSVKIVQTMASFLLRGFRPLPFKCLPQRSHYVTWITTLPRKQTPLRSKLFAPFFGATWCLEPEKHYPKHRKREVIKLAPLKCMWLDNRLQNSRFLLEKLLDCCKIIARLKCESHTWRVRRLTPVLPHV